jgi:hypothetical protein
MYIFCFRGEGFLGIFVTSALLYSLLRNTAFTGFVRAIFAFLGKEYASVYV